MDPKYYELMVDEILVAIGRLNTKREYRKEDQQSVEACVIYPIDDHRIVNIDLEWHIGDGNKLHVYDSTRNNELATLNTMAYLLPRALAYAIAGIIAGSYFEGGSR